MYPTKAKEICNNGQACFLFMQCIPIVKKCYMGIFYDFFIAQIRLLLMSKGHQNILCARMGRQEARWSTGEFSLVN